MLLPAPNPEEVTQARRREERGQPFAARHPRLPDTIEDDWIEDIERLEKELKSFTNPESPAYAFSLRCGDLMSVDGDDRGWEACTKVVARRDIEEWLMRPWNGRRG